MGFNPYEWSIEELEDYIDENSYEMSKSELREMEEALEEMKEQRRLERREKRQAKKAKIPSFIRV